MDLRLARAETTAESIIGGLYFEGRRLCFTREELPRSDRLFVAGETPLPAGNYNLSLSYCSRFKRDLPLLASTGGRADERRRASDRLGMRIHPGHPAVDMGSEILLGLERWGTTVAQTRPAFEAVLRLISEALARNEAVDFEIR